VSKNVQRQALAVALSAVLTLAACGGGDGPDDAVTGFADAVAEEDYAAACEYLGSEVQAGAEDAGGCAAALETTLTEEDISQAESLEAEVVEEDDDTATVETSVEGEEPETVELVKEDDEWRISGVP
jgi:hypothetical protein